ncbi:alpha/beta hydrolase family protein [Streptomyces viridochromogenes]|uniref:alpha/beta hydrolase family protein n=1 Tax=Streptomyces viridochromogenes TaxID=1938 RepID=UPI001F2EC3DF|nr:prolyl oligopeptidase family serine peptidase [Streptomyces viridochromogenes]
MQGVVTLIGVLRGWPRHRSLEDHLATELTRLQHENPPRRCRRRDARDEDDPARRLRAGAPHGAADGLPPDRTGAARDRRRPSGARLHGAWAVAEGYADRDPAAIFEGSYGGYAALAGVSFTPDVFAAAIDVCGSSNLVTFLRTVPEFVRPTWSTTGTSTPAHR